ncbi:TPA: hypothetical protein ACGAP6_003288, partial [Legionella pneumophila]
MTEIKQPTRLVINQYELLVTVMQSKSVRKERFQAYPVGTGLYDTTTMLTAEDLGEIFNYYEKKHGIRLIRNGD